MILADHGIREDFIFSDVASGRSRLKELLLPSMLRG